MKWKFVRVGPWRMARFEQYLKGSVLCSWRLRSIWWEGRTLFLLPMEQLFDVRGNNGFWIVIVLQLAGWARSVCAWRKTLVCWYSQRSQKAKTWVKDITEGRTGDDGQKRSSDWGGNMGMYLGPCRLWLQDNNGVSIGIAQGQNGCDGRGNFVADWTWDIVAIYPHVGRHGATEKLGIAI